MSAQTAAHLNGQVRDTSGRAVAGASVTASGNHGAVIVSCDADGRFHLDYADLSGDLRLRATARSMESDFVTVAPTSLAGDVALVLRPSVVNQQVSVTATRSSIDLPATANTTYALSSQELSTYPAAALDDKLRAQAGFELFRRATSHVANPTSQGISLRGLGSTAASRTLVLQEGVPMNDAFGDWIHWDELPADTLEAVMIATGGGSDLYGSSALGGVVDVIPARPSSKLAEISAAGGGQDTSSLSARGDVAESKWSELAAADLFRTAGYIPTAPGVLGPVDVPANVHYEAGRTEIDRGVGAGRAFVIGNVLNEARNNGTRYQTNGTRLWRYIGGEDWNAGSHVNGRVRVFGSDEAYRQSFSSINATRTTEALTRLQKVRTQEVGGSSDATVSFSSLAVVAGADVRDIRATDAETPISNGAPNGVVNTSARQRFAGGFGEALASHGPWSGAVSLRLDAVENVDTRAITLPSSAPQPVLTPDRSEFIASPRLGIVRQLPGNVAVHASVFRAFRTPTMNELYRTGQVGQETTQANSQLQSERATGWEIGANFAPSSRMFLLQGTYFWTEINRPVSAVLISSTPTSILDKRQNLGQILSQGTELHLALRPGKAISATFGYQYAHAVVTRFSATPALVGNWIPQVPRQSFTAQFRAARAKLGEVTVAARASGKAFDDSANTFVLDSFFNLDASARHDFGSRWTGSVTVQNILNQRPNVSRTPTLTLGSPLLAQGGVAFHWGGTQSH